VSVCQNGKMFVNLRGSLPAWTSNAGGTSSPYFSTTTHIVLRIQTKGQVCQTPYRTVGRVLISLLRLWARRWINYWSQWRMASATPDLWLPSQPQSNHLFAVIFLFNYIDLHRLGGRKGIRPVKNWVVGCWCGYLSGARCRLAYGPADATATHCHPSSPGQRAVKRV